MTHRCIICHQEEYVPLYGGKIINLYTLNQCKYCRMVYGFPTNEGQDYDDFDSYGDYLILNERETKKRISGVSFAMKDVFIDIKRKYRDAKILDFGCGAGFFLKAAKEAGLDTYGVEPSEKLRLFCRKKLDLKNIVKCIGKLDHKFNVIFMFDVLEHLNPTISINIMSQLVSHLKPNGLLIGQTPNFKSANILLCRDKDPVIWPPSHSCYFTMETLDKYLSSFRLKKVRLYSKGLSSNSFFRKQKFEKSFLEKGVQNMKLYLIPLYVLLKLFFRFLGFVMQPFNLGYQISFTYTRKT